MAGWLRINFGRRKREWAYQAIQPRLIAEKLLDDGTGDLPDYKFHCFDGEPRLIQYDVRRFTDHRRELFTPEWQKITDYRRLAAVGPINHKVPTPSNLGEMLSCARRLSAGFRYVRVDLYSVGGRTVFGEMTWYPGGGLETFSTLDRAHATDPDARVPFPKCRQVD